MDAQDNQDGTLLHDLQTFKYKPLLIIDLIRISPLQFPHFIPLFERESNGPFGTLADVTVRSSRGTRRVVGPCGSGAQQLRMRFQCLARGRSQTSLVGLA